MPDFEPAVRAAAKLMIEVGAVVARHCDAVANAATGRPPALHHQFESIIADSQHHASRVLHYFASKGDGTQDDPTSSTVSDNWCGWHNDHCLLTALLPAGYHEDSSGRLIPNPDPKAGLYVKNRQGQVFKVGGAGEDTLLLQIGETAQILSGGALKATPHMVAAASTANVSRSTMAVFMEPGSDYVLGMPAGAQADYALSCEHLPPGVPLLSRRWQPDVSFGDFSRVTFAAYYP